MLQATANWNLPTGTGQEGEDMQSLIDAQARTIGDQAGLIRYYQELLNLVDPEGIEQPWSPTNPVASGSTAPVNSHFWFNTGNGTLNIWNVGASPNAGSVFGWLPVGNTVLVQATPPTAPITIGQLWMESTTNKLYCWDGWFWYIITWPIAGAQQPPTGATFVAQEPAPAAGQLWYQPSTGILSFRVGSVWTNIGTIPATRVKVISPPGMIMPTGTWQVGVRAGDTLYIAGMRGIDPVTNLQVDSSDGGLNRVKQAYKNMKALAASEGCTLWDCTRHVVFVTDMATYRPLVNTVQALPENWGHGPYPTRTIVQVVALNGSDAEQKVPPWPKGDFVEVEGTFYCPQGAPEQDVDPASLALGQMIRMRATEEGAQVAAAEPAPEPEPSPPARSKRK